jgi:hypothetical protein
MRRWSRGVVAALLALGSSAALSAAPTEPPLPRFMTPPRLADGSAAPRRGAVPHALPSPDGAPIYRLRYYGGRVISNVQIYAVNWGPNVNAQIAAQIGGFYTAITSSTYFDWLAEYDTAGLIGQDGLPGSDQRIGRGSFAGSFTITPGNTATALTNDQVGAELVAQLTAGSLPAPSFDAAGNVNTIYMIDFPPGIDITLGKDKSCVQFGAYHFSIAYGGKNVPYGVHPDCAYPFNVETSIHSHELTEAVTDTEVGAIPDAIPTFDRPGAWYWYETDQNQGEIGDICTKTTGTVGTYTVQAEWSNTQGACVTSSATIICDGRASPIAGCRACTAADNGVACNGARPVCETDSANAKVGQCVECTADAQCPAIAPTCKKSADDADDSCTGTPVTCTTNAQCSGPTPICDPNTKTCRICKIDIECAPGACEPNPADPKYGTCVQCVTNTTCVAPARCDTTSHTCVAAPDAGTDAAPPPPDAAPPPPDDAGCPGCADPDAAPPVDDAGSDAGGGGGGSSGCAIGARRGASGGAATAGLVIALATLARRRRRRRAALDRASLRYASRALRARRGSPARAR